MASKFPADGEEKVEMRNRKGHDMTWSCDKHGEPIKFYCRVHEIAICHPCATKDHVKKQCELDDIEDVILKRRKELDEKLVQIEEARKRLKRIDSEVQPCVTLATNHLQSVNDEVNAAYEGKLKSVKDKEQEQIRLINVEADEEIRIINEKREKRIKACREEADEQHRIIEDIQAKLLSEIKDIDLIVGEKTEDLKNKHAISTMDKMDSKITRIKQDDKTLVNEAPQVIASLDESLSANVRQDVANYLDKILGEVQRVKFVEGEFGGEHYARIDGYVGKYELVKSIQIPSIVNGPFVLGLISDDEICVEDRMTSDLYVTNISSEHTEKLIIIDSRPNAHITSCAPIDSNVVVCGKGRGDCNGDSLDGCITLYDRQWKVIRDITIPRHKSFFSKVYIDVDRDGMILATQVGRSDIYVINPTDGKIVNAITKVSVSNGIKNLSSGDIVIIDYDGYGDGYNESIVISRSGEVKAVIDHDEWVGSRCSVDKLTDTLYITYWDEERDIYAVDQVSCDGDIQARRIVECVKSDRCRWGSLCLVTPSGNLIACNGDNFFVYKKSFIV